LVYLESYIINHGSLEGIAVEGKYSNFKSELKPGWLKLDELSSRTRAGWFKEPLMCTLLQTLPPEGGGEDEVVDDQAVKVVDIVDTFRLQVRVLMSTPTIIPTEIEVKERNRSNYK
ncbi:hypothetical protein Tco_1528570, partial [Tanacetum coccineum]